MALKGGISAGCGFLALSMNFIEDGTPCISGCDIACREGLGVVCRHEVYGGKEVTDRLCWSMFSQTAIQRNFNHASST